MTVHTVRQYLYMIATWNYFYVLSDFWTQILVCLFVYLFCFFSFLRSLYISCLSFITFSGPSGPECQCPSTGNWYLANDGKDCIPDNGQRCHADQFTCLDGSCLFQRWKCNGYRDCLDGSDELERVCGK